MTALRDPATGLPIATFSSLPLALQSKILRNAQKGVAPLVFFVEWFKKLSDGARKRGTKDRVVIMTPDVLLVFAGDGSIKRRVRICDVAHIYLSHPVSASSLDLNHRPSSAAVPQGPSRMRTSGSDSNSSATTAQLYVASVACEVPRQFDFALDIVRTHPAECRSVMARFIRVITVLHRQATGKCFDPAVSLLRPGCLGGHPGSELEYFRLKKAHAAGPHPHGKKGPLLAPVLPLVTEAMERQSEEDPQAHMDQTIQDVAVEIRRFREENIGRAFLEAWRALESYASRCTDVEKERARTRMHRERLETRAAEYDRELRLLETDLRETHQAYLQEARVLDALRAQHDVEVAALRTSAEAAEERTRRYEHERTVGEQRYLETMRRELDPQRAAAEAELAARVEALRRNESELPAEDRIFQEIHAAEQGLSALDAQRSAVQEARARREETKTLRRKLKDENAALECSAAAALESARVAKATTEQLLAQVSLALATRNRVRVDLANKQRSLEQLQAELDDEEKRRLALAEELSAEQRRQSTQHLEAVVVEDLQRSVEMNDALARSVVQLANDELLQNQRQEQCLVRKLERLRQARAEKQLTAATPGSLEE